MISRKPWVCLSCDKQENAKKELKGKKVESIRQGGKIYFNIGFIQQKGS